MNRKNNNGFSVVEVLLATVLFAIIMLGLSNYLHTLIYKYYNASTLLQADQVAFQLLESYPYTIKVAIPDTWQYDVNRQHYNAQCQFIIITIALPTQKSLQQKRLICQ